MKTPAKRPTARMAGIHKGRKRGEWLLEVCVPGTGGKVRRRRKVTAHGRQEVATAWKAFRDEVFARGGKGRAWTLRTYLDTFGPRLSVRLTGEGPRNFGYRCKTLLSLIGDERLDKITQATFRDLLGAFAARGYSASTSISLVATLRKILHDAVDRRELVRYPAGRLQLPRVEPLRLEMSDEEREAFLQTFDDEAAFRRHIAGQRVARIEEGRRPNVFALPDGEEAGVEFSFFRSLKPLFVVALETGLSRSDLRSLTWADVEGPVIVRRRQKTGVEAVIPITAACRGALEQARSLPLAHASRVFVSPYTGKPLCLDTINKTFRMAKRLAGITRRFRFHDLRHTFASRLASAGVSLQVIAKALGHTSIAMSQRYARPDARAMEEVKNALERAGTNLLTNSADRFQRGK